MKNVDVKTLKNWLANKEAVLIDGINAWCANGYETISGNKKSIS